jgi:hypothetical protein
MVVMTPIIKRDLLMPIPVHVDEVLLHFVGWSGVENDFVLGRTRIFLLLLDLRRTDFKVSKEG